MLILIQYSQISVISHDHVLLFTDHDHILLPYFHCSKVRAGL
jgi:hypothetical protein